MGWLSQTGISNQLLLSPNPSNGNHRPAQEFREDNSRQGRRYYSARSTATCATSPPETIRALESGCITPNLFLALRDCTHD